MLRMSRSLLEPMDHNGDERACPHYRQDGSLAFKGPLRMEHAAPFYNFENPTRMEEYLGSPVYVEDESLLHNNPNDPYGLFSRPTVTEAQRCLMDFPTGTRTHALFEQRYLLGAYAVVPAGGKEERVFNELLQVYPVALPGATWKKST